LFRIIKKTIFLIELEINLKNLIYLNTAKYLKPDVLELLHQLKQHDSHELLNNRYFQINNYAEQIPMGFPKGRIGILPFGCKREFTSRAAKSIKGGLNNV